MDERNKTMVRAVRALASYVVTHGSCGRDAKALARALGGEMPEYTSGCRAAPVPAAAAAWTRQEQLSFCLDSCAEALAAILLKGFPLLD